MENKQIITGIDIGTTKIAVLIAEKTNNRTPKYKTTVAIGITNKLDTKKQTGNW